VTPDDVSVDEMALARVVSLALPLAEPRAGRVTFAQLVDQHQALPWLTDTIEGPSLDQRLDSSLVERGRIDPIHKIQEGFEGAILSGFDDPLDRCLTHVAYRRQTEPDPALMDREV